MEIIPRGQKLLVPVTLYVNDTTTISGRALIDLGSGGTVTVTSAVAKKYHLEKTTPSYTYSLMNGGIGGGSKGTDIRIDSVVVGGHTLIRPIIDFSLNETGALSDREYIAIIGNDIWERFDMTLDRTHSMREVKGYEYLYLRPNKNFSNPFRFSETGMGFTDRSQTLGAWIVNCLYEKSIAERAGLRLGDRILSWNGKDVNTIDIYEQQDLMSKSSQYELLIERDGKRTNVIIKR